MLRWKKLDFPNFSHSKHIWDFKDVNNLLHQFEKQVLSPSSQQEVMSQTFLKKCFHIQAYTPLFLFLLSDIYSLVTCALLHTTKGPQATEALFTFSKLKFGSEM